jgi:hypothetical protein
MTNSLIEQRTRGTGASHSPSSRASCYRSSAFALLCATALISCASIRVGNDYDRSTEFTHYRTYTWLPREHFGNHNPLVVRHAHEAIDAELKRKGFVLAEKGTTADIAVDFTVGSRERLQIQSYPTSYRGPWMWGRPYFGNQIDVNRYREGVLAIDVFDAQTHQPIWTGWAAKLISQSDMENSEDTVRSAASAVLAEFPPH